MAVIRIIFQNQGKPRCTYDKMSLNHCETGGQLRLSLMKEFNVLTGSTFYPVQLNQSIAATLLYLNSGEIKKSSYAVVSHWRGRTGFTDDQLPLYSQSDRMRIQNLKQLRSVKLIYPYK